MRTIVPARVIVNRANGGFTVLLQNDEKGHVIIGEAALHLALTNMEINVSSLLAELKRMAAAQNSDARLSEISEARNWLKGFITQGQAEQKTALMPENVVRLRPEDEYER